MLLMPSLSFACFALLFFVLSFLLPFGNPRNIILPTTVTAQSNLFMLTMVLLNLLRLMQPYVHWVPPSLRQRGRLLCCFLTTTSHQSHSPPLAYPVQVLSYRFPPCLSLLFVRQPRHCLALLPFPAKPTPPVCVSHLSGAIQVSIPQVNSTAPLFLPFAHQHSLPTPKGSHQSPGRNRPA